MDLFTAVTSLAGVGPTRAKQLSTLGIETLYDLLTYFPRTYEDRTKLVRICDLEADQPACFRAMVIRGPKTAHIRNLRAGVLFLRRSPGRLHRLWHAEPRL